MLNQLTKTHSIHSKNTNVLLVDENRDDFHLVEKLLNDQAESSFEVLRCPNLDALPKLLRKNKFDAILLNLNANTLSASDSLKTLVKLSPFTPIIVLTEPDDEVLGYEAIREGAADYLFKGELNGRVLSRTILFAIERHDLTIQIKCQTERDALTNLCNRSTLYRHLETLITQAERNNCLLALALFDIDNFNKFNDIFGQDVGDQLLINVAGRLQQNLRKSDLAVRFGSDEFILVMTNYVQLEKLIHNKFKCLSRPYTLEFEGENHELEVGISMGVSEWKSGIIASELIAKADRAMQVSKNSGKNMVTLDIPKVKKLFTYLGKRQKTPVEYVRE